MKGYPHIITSIPSFTSSVQNTKPVWASKVVYYWSAKILQYLHYSRTIWFWVVDIVLQCRVFTKLALNHIAVTSSTILYYIWQYNIYQWHIALYYMTSDNANNRSDTGWPRRSKISDLPVWVLEQHQTWLLARNMQALYRSSGHRYHPGHWQHILSCHPPQWQSWWLHQK